MYDTALIQRLRQKLSYGNRRSIHLNALPGNLLTRLDAIGLDQLQAGLSDRFLAQLLDQTTFELTLAFKPPVGKSLHELTPDEQKALQHTARRLDGLVYDNRDHYLTYGTETFGFGFPLLLRRDTQQPDKIIKAPVFIWQLGLEKIDSQTLAWRVRRSDDRAVYINPILLSHLENDTGLNLSALRTEHAEDGYLSRQDITDFCNQLLAQINANHDYALPALVPCPNNDTLKHIGIGKPLIRWSGVFGLYRMPKQAIIDDLDRLVQNPTHSAAGMLNTANSSPQKSSPELLKTRHTTPKSTDYVVRESTFEPPIRFAAVSTDPAQQAIVNRLGQTQYQIIQGPPGTGKSQSLTALLTRALADGKRCLVVCEKRAALEVLQRNLQRVGLADLSILIEDTDRDRQRVVNAVRQSMEAKTTLPPYAPATLVQQEQTAETAARQLLRQHQFLAQKRWHHYNWTNLVGKYCHANERQNKQCLDTHLFALSLRHFQFDAPTFDRLHQTVQQAQPLYAAVGTLQHPLTAIDPHWFATRQSGDLYQYLEQSLPRFIGSAQGLIEAGESLLLRYTQLLGDHYAQYVQEVGLQIEQLLQGMAQGRAQYGEVFDQWRGLSKLWVNLCATLSPHHRQLRQDREQIVEQYQAFSQYIAQYTHGVLLQSRTYIDHTAIATQPHDPPFSLSDIAQSLARCQTNLANMTAQTRDWVDLYAKNLNVGFVLPHLHDVMSHPTATWQTQTQQFLHNLQAEKLLQSPTAWEHNPDIAQQAIAEQLRVLRIVAAQLQTIYAALPQFRVFYQWQHFWATQPNDAQQLLIALARSSASDWTAAYESWYLNNWLIRLETDAVPQSDAAIRTLSTAIEQVAAQLSPAIQHYWQSEQRSRTANFDQRQTNQFNAKRLYNQRSTQERRRSTLRQIVHADFDLFSAYFPICLVNPVVCSSLFPLQRALFDVVIFDEAGQLRIEDTYCALWRGHTQIVSGDMHQMPPSDYFQSHQAQLLDTNADADPDTLYTEDSDLADRESLLAYAEDRNFEQSYLDFHYRSQHPYLIDFSNAAFYQSRLVPMPALSPYTPIYFEAVNGVYGNQTNPAEADAIVRYLSTQIPAAAQSEQLPSVGVATLNLYQRNLILDNLQRLKAQGGTAASHIIALEARGLFVKNLENIQGDERDIMLVSTTFGLRDDGKFTQHFGAINTQKGYRLLNVLVTRAKQRMCIFTSIPPAYYQRYAEELQKSTPSGRVYLYAYLCYAQAVAEGKEDARLQLLQQLSQYAPISDKPTQGKDLSADSSKAPNNMAVGDDLLNYIADSLRRYLPASYRVQTRYMQGGISLPIAVWYDKPNTAPKLIAAIECDHAPQHHSPEAYMYDLSRQRCFAQMGAATLRTYAADWWLNPDTTCRNLCAELWKHTKLSSR